MRYKLFVLLLALAAAPAFAKSLHWRSVDVKATLDRDGRLHVSERQAFVFDGDWNGGERSFRVAAGQSLQLESIDRLDSRGVPHALIGGNLDEVDHFAFSSANVLRWRSRLPSDPPFENQEITYVIRYTLSGVLRQTGGAYYLNHDFVFPERAGSIERFSLRFDLDPVWRGAKSPIVVERRDLAPGRSAIVQLQLEFAGATAPAAVVRTMSRGTMFAIKALFALGLALLIFDFALAEMGKGRFAPILSPSHVDEAFLRENLLTLKPEVAGAALDNKTGAPEVAAVLARLTQEGKIASSVERRGTMRKHQVLCLTLKADKSALPDYEGKLVRALFFSGNTTDTDKIRAHYKNKGFDPAKIIESGVKPELQHTKVWKDSVPRANWKHDAIFAAGALVLAIIAALRGDNDTSIAVSIIFIGAFLGGFAALAANLNSRAVTNFVPRFAIPAFLLAPLVWFTWGYVNSSIYFVLHFLTPVAICLLALAIVKLVLDALRSPESPERIAFRKRLYAARNYFLAELSSQNPRIRDEWYPWLLAFGLGKHVDRWFGHYGTAPGVSAGSTESHLHGSSSSSSSASSPAPAPAFSGGGGAFGGAGASGGWAVAAAAIGAGVASPSSGGSGSGGGGGGGGSSSGGGGGGGW